MKMPFILEMFGVRYIVCNNLAFGAVKVIFEEIVFGVLELQVEQGIILTWKRSAFKLLNLCLILVILMLCFLSPSD